MNKVNVSMVKGERKGDSGKFAHESDGTLLGNFMFFWKSVLRAEAPAQIIVTAADYSYSVEGGVGQHAHLVSENCSFFAPYLASIDNAFHVTDRGSSFLHEFIGGLTTFFSMCYIMVLNGIIIGGQWPIGTGLSTNAVFFSTTLSAGLFTFAMGAFVNIPVALAPGMGLNGYFATVAKSCQENPTGSIHGTPCKDWGDGNLPWSDAMGAVFVSGWIYLFLTFTGLRAMLFRAVPPSLRSAISVGIGFFITIIGINIGAITRVTLANWALAYHVIPQGECDSYGCKNAVDLDFTYYSLGMVRYNYHPPARIAVLGVILASGFECVGMPGSIIAAIVIATLVGINYVHCDSMKLGNTCVTNLSAFSGDGPKYIVDTSDISAGHLSFKYANKPIFWESVFTFLFVEMFDSFGTLSGIMERCGFMKGNPELAMARVNRAMCIDGCSLWLGGLIGANSCTSFVESNTGVQAGARTGISSIVTGSCFLLSLLFMAPFVAVIPDSATTCALVMVGIHSLSAMENVNLGDFIDKLTAFLTIAMMGFTYSITNGISTGFVFFSWMRTVKIIFIMIKKKFYPDCTDEAPEWPHPIMFGGAIFGVVRFCYLGDFVIHNGVAPAGVYDE